MFFLCHKRNNSIFSHLFPVIYKLHNASLISRSQCIYFFHFADIIMKKGKVYHCWHISYFKLHLFLPLFHHTEQNWVQQKNCLHFYRDFFTILTLILSLSLPYNSVSPSFCALPILLLCGNPFPVWVFIRWIFSEILWEFSKFIAKWHDFYFCCRRSHHQVYVMQIFFVFGCCYFSINW